MITKLSNIYLLLLLLGLSFFNFLSDAQASESPPPIYNAMTMQDVGEALDLLGLKYQSEAVTGQRIVADTRLAVRDEMVWFIYGYNCHAVELSCTELQMRAVIEQPVAVEIDYKFLDSWNRKSRFVRAYQSASGNAVILEMDIYLAGGVALQNITDQILLWRQSLSEFIIFLEQE